MSSSEVSAPQLAPTRDAGGTLRDDLRGVKVIWRRELIRFVRNKAGIVTSLAQPVLFLFVLGTGLAPIVRAGPGEGFDFRTFMFPGVIAMTVLFTGVFSAMSIIWDREFGFLREILVAPVRRVSIVIGKCVGGATVATAQAVIILALAGLVHVPYHPGLMATLLAYTLLASVACTALGILVASHVDRIEAFPAVTQFLVMPMFFLSGAIFPVAALPTWLELLAKINPLTYAVVPMRLAVFDYAGVPAEAQAVLHPGVTWWGWEVAVPVQLGVVALFGVVCLAFAVRRFSKPE